MASCKKYSFHRHLPHFQTGFTLVEIMVGLAIGMLATLVILQVFSVFEAQKRTTTGSGDAQTNGNIALYTLARDLKLAGYGLLPTSLPAMNSPLKCANLIVDGAVDANVPNRVFPLAITDDVAGSGISPSDVIRISYADSQLGANPIPIVKMGPAANLPTANDAQVGDSFGCEIGSRTLVLSQDGLNCSLSTASNVVAASAPNPAYVTLADASVAGAGANLACLGTWNEFTYAVNNGNLERNGTPLVAGIVNLQAQYGISAAGKTNADADFNTVVDWVDAAGAWAAPAVADRIRIKAVRIAVVARNPRKETKDPATGTCVTTTACSALNAPDPSGLCAWAGTASSVAPAIDLSAGDPDWGCYRYRVFETVIPLRNVIWAKPML